MYKSILKALQVREDPDLYSVYYSLILRDIDIDSRTLGAPQSHGRAIQTGLMRRPVLISPTYALVLSWFRSVVSI